MGEDNPFPGEFVERGRIFFRHGIRAEAVPDQDENVLGLTMRRLGMGWLLGGFGQAGGEHEGRNAEGMHYFHKEEAQCSRKAPSRLANPI